jgi:hypothetical protein
MGPNGLSMTVRELGTERKAFEVGMGLRGEGWTSGLRRSVYRRDRQDLLSQLSSPR